MRSHLCHKQILSTGPDLPPLRVALDGDVSETPPRHHGYDIWRPVRHGRHADLQGFRMNPYP